MRGITHYLTALGTASLLPGAMLAATNGHPSALLLGGLGGLLPDFLDFKLWRYLPRAHVEIAPDPNAPSPRLVAETLASIAAATFADGRRRLVRLHPIRLSATSCIPYSILVHPQDNSLTVSFSPPRAPLAPAAAPQSVDAHTLRLSAPVHFDYYATIEVGEMEGPMLALSRDNRHQLQISFLPWHRNWSHSLVLALGPALLMGVLLTPLAGTALLAGWASHVLLDQIGTLGCNLAWPISRARTPGLGLASSSSTVGNALLAWTALIALLGAANSTMYRPSFGAVTLLRVWLAPVLPLLIARVVQGVRLRLH